MAIVFWGVSPHPPLLIPGVSDLARDKVQATKKALSDWAQALKEQEPDRIVLMSPHAPSCAWANTVFSLPNLRGSMERFGQPQQEMEWPIDIDFVGRLAARCKELELPLLVIDEECTERYRVKPTIDHGSFVPLYFIKQAQITAKLVILGYSGLEQDSYLRLGQLLRELTETEEANTAVIASGDLSHRLSEAGPYGFNAAGPVFDQKINDILRDLDQTSLLNFTPDQVEAAGQCGLDSITMLFGSLRGNPQVHHLSYEGPFGVGYAVCYYLPEYRNESGSTEEADEVGENGEKQMDACKEAEQGTVDKCDPRVELARRSVECYVTTGKPLELQKGEYPELSEPAAVFVTLKENDELRGCIGTLAPYRNTQAEEILYNAISACSHDPRFEPVRPEELPKLHYQVYVLGAPMKVAGPQELDPKRYGVIVRKGSRSGVLLPDLEGIDSVEMQIGIACRKGGISPEENPELYRFTAKTYN